MSERERTEIEPGYYAYEYSEEELRELYSQMPEGLEDIEEYLSPPEPRGPFERLWARLFSEK